MSIRFITICLLLSASFLSAQKTEWIVDTIYTDVLHPTNAIILTNDTASIVINKDGINPFHLIKDSRWLFLSKRHIVEIENKAYLLNEDLKINFDQGIDLDLSSQFYGGQHLSVINQTIAYVVNDSVFIDNFTRPNRTFVATDMLPFLKNDRYLWLQKEYPEEDYIYDIARQKLRKLPDNFKLPKTENRHFIVNTTLSQNFDETVEVLDLSLNKIIDPREGYESYEMNADVLAVFGPNKPLKYWYKGKSKSLPDNIVYIDLMPKSGISIVKNKQGKFGIINAQAKVIHPFQFDECSTNFFSGPIITAKKDHLVYVLNDQGEIIFQGKFDDVKYLSPDRFQVESNYSLGVVNSKSEIIIPFKRNRNGAYYYRKEYGKEIIYWDFRDQHQYYTYEGELILECTVTNKEPKTASKEYMSGYSWNMIKKLTDYQIEQINPSNLWMHRQEFNGKRHVALENHNGIRLTDWYTEIKRIDNSNTYLAKTKNGKYGVLKVKN